MAAASLFRLSPASKDLSFPRRRTRKQQQQQQIVFLPSCTTTSTSTSTSGGTPTTASPLRPPLRTTTSRKKKKKIKITHTDCVPTPEEASISVSTLYQNGDPLGRKELGKCVVRWISHGMKSLASDFAAAEIHGDFADLRTRLHPSTTSLDFLIHAQPYLYAVPMPKGLEALCFKACTHYPTLFDHFQRELRLLLQDLQRQSVFPDWQATLSWKLLKDLAHSAQHRAAVRKTPQPKPLNTGLGLELDKARIIQDRIQDFVTRMSDLLRIERDAELEFTQEELNAVPVVVDETAQVSKPIEYLVSHGQAQQEQCDTICNLSAISSSTGLGGMHLVLFRAEGNHKLPPTTLSPGDMVCVRSCNNRGAGATSCMQGFVNNLGDDGCSITVALESRHGDPTFSKLFGKNVRIDRIHGLADAVTYEATWITQCPLLLLDTRMPYGSLYVGCEEYLDPAGTGSLYNEGEADIVMQHVFNLIYSGVPPSTIAVQSPYIAQVQLLRDKLDEFPEAHGVEISTIDSFQGREADAVIISMVRSNTLGAVGFLGDSRRMNVALTRARKHVAVVCDSSTICHNTFLARLLRHIRRHGRVKHAEPGSFGGSGLTIPMLPSIS